MFKDEDGYIRSLAIQIITFFIEADKSLATYLNLNTILVMLEDKDRQVRFQASKAIPYFIKANKALGTNDVMNKIEEAKK